MKKSEMQVRFRDLLEENKKAIRDMRDECDYQTSMMFYGKVCGIASAMRVIGLIDFDQESEIKDEAWSVVEGKEPEYEAC